MTRLLVSTLLLLSLVGPLPARAGDPAAPAPAATAPDGEGCMPGGGCCGGSAACPKAPRDAQGKVEGGCPCQKAKAAAQQNTPPAAQ
jgi:hypothetical protein